MHLKGKHCNLFANMNIECIDIFRLINRNIRFFNFNNFDIGILTGFILLISLTNARPQQQRQFNDIRDNTIDTNGQRNNGRRNYQRNPVVGDEISQKFLSFDVPETVEAYQPNLNQKADVPIDLGERSKSSL